MRGTKTTRLTAGCDSSCTRCCPRGCEKAAIDLAKKARPRLNPGRTDRSIRSGISPGRSEFKPQSRIIFRRPVRHRAQQASSIELIDAICAVAFVENIVPANCRSEEHTSELQSLMRISYAVFCLKKKSTHIQARTENH